MTDPDTLAVGFRGDPGDVTQQAWEAPGPSTYVTTHEPLPKWPHVWTGGVEQVLGEDFEQSAKTLTVLVGMELEAADDLVCRYDYLEGPVSFVQPAEPSGVIEFIGAAAASSAVAYNWGGGYAINEVLPLEAGDLIVVAQLGYDDGSGTGGTDLPVIWEGLTGHAGHSADYLKIRADTYSPTGPTDTWQLSGSGSVGYAVYRNAALAGFDHAVFEGANGGTAPAPAEPHVYRVGIILGRRIDGRIFTGGGSPTQRGLYLKETRGYAVVADSANAQDCSGAVQGDGELNCVTVAVGFGLTEAP